MKRNISALLFLLIALCGLIASADAQDTSADKRRKWRVMVIIPETHLTRPHIPDPAAETMFCKKLIDAGYKVIDQERYAALRYNEVVDQIFKGGPTWRKDVKRICSRFGADVLITGSAFTQEVSNKTIDTEAGRVNSIKCRCRIELKGILADSAEKFYVDSIQKTGPADLTVELSSKICLEAGAEEMAANQIENLDKRLLGAGHSDTPTPQLVELHIRNMPDGLIDKVESTLKRVPGIVNADPGSFDQGDYSTELKIPQGESPTRIASRIVAFPALKSLKLRVVSSNSTRIILSASK